MISDIVEINEYVVLIERYNAKVATIEKCELDGNIIGFAFYGSGDVELEITHAQTKDVIHNTTGIAISFFGNNLVEFAHKISPQTPLQSITVFIKLKNLSKLSLHEQAIFQEKLLPLIKPKANFVLGPSFNMTPDMRRAVSKIHQSNYSGVTRLLFLKSQVSELLAHFFALLEYNEPPLNKTNINEKLYRAREIITSNLTTPPSLSELSLQIGLNSNKLKKNFKELFGVPVFKYLQDQRLTKAYELLQHSDMNVQEVAWYVGYESLSSFSNAFQKKFEIRPLDLKKKFLSNK